jgi:hypothetical protein
VILTLLGKKEGRVPLSIDVVSKCICDACPVQAQSACSMPKIQKMAEVKNMSKMGTESSGMPSGMSMSLTGDPNVKMDLDPKVIAGPYCASGVASMHMSILSGLLRVQIDESSTGRTLLF